MQVGSNYAAIYLGIYNLLWMLDPNPPFAGYLTTHHSFGGSEVIPSDTWLWTQIMISPKGAGYGYDFSVSKTGYGNKDFLYGEKTGRTQTWWDGLADARFFIRLVDNYRPGAYFELAEASIRSPDPPAVPEPATMLASWLGFYGAWQACGENSDRGKWVRTEWHCGLQGKELWHIGRVGS